MQSQSLVLAQPADSTTLSTALGNLTDTIFRAAEENINTALADSDPDAYSAIERRAMIATEALRLTNGMDLAAILTRGDIIAQIEREGLAGVHPNGYADLSALAREQSISLTELSNTRALCETIFPYVVEVLQRPIAEVWTAVGKSNFIEMIPALRALISGEDAAHTSVRTAVETMLNEAAATLITAGELVQGDLSDEAVAAVRRQAIQTLLVNGQTMTARDMRRTVRPTRTPPVESATLQTGEHAWFTVLKIDSREQYDNIMRLLGTHANNMLLEGRGSAAGEHRRILHSFFGG